MNACTCGHTEGEHWHDTGPCMVSTEAETWACPCAEYQSAADLVAAGRILIRFFTTDGEWWDLSDTDLQIDGTIDLTPDEVEVLRRLSTSS